jgi:hypothetical protein
MAEFAVAGKDGVVGISLFMGGNSTPSRAVVQVAGQAYRLEAEALKREFALGGAVQQLLLRYTQSLLTQVIQIAMCNKHHALNQQFCRWLLLTLDLLPTNQLKMTQELIASMLGVRREGVTAAAGRLRAAGIIDCTRGQITVLDRARLEKKVCECYAVIKGESDRLLPQRPSAPPLASTIVTFTPQKSAGRDPKIAGLPEKSLLNTKDLNSEQALG